MALALLSGDGATSTLPDFETFYATNPHLAQKETLFMYPTIRAIHPLTVFDSQRYYSKDTLFKNPVARSDWVDPDIQELPTSINVLHPRLL